MASQGLLEGNILFSPVIYACLRLIKILDLTPWLFFCGFFHTIYRLVEPFYASSKSRRLPLSGLE